MPQEPLLLVVLERKLGLQLRPLLIALGVYFLLYIPIKQERLLELNLSQLLISSNLLMLLAGQIGQ
jgi:hypothetical protein